MFDSIIIGSGFAGSVIAERLANEKGKKILVIEQRQHLGGNCYDYHDEHGVLIHKYGPHLFHTSNKAVFDYLSRFTEWLSYQHEVLAKVDGQEVPIPFNLNSLRIIFGEEYAQTLENELIDAYGFGTKVPILELRKTGGKNLKFLADFIYEKIFINYTSKQWGCKPEEVSPEVTARVPVNICRDNRYFQDKYQAIPKHGYTKIFERMLDHPNIKLMLNCQFQDLISINHEQQKISLLGNEFKGDFIYTGAIDELFNFEFGALPYRSLQFKFEHINQPFFQPKTTVNYPNEFDFTRITEFKRISQQDSKGTTIVREYPQDYVRDDPERNVPYYPVFNDANQQVFDKYWALAETFNQIKLVGRLAEYRYYDMDDVIARALNVFDNELSI